jgi:hypothetical protein
VKRTHAGELVTLEGIVTPGDWDDRQRVTACILWTFNEEEYRLFFRNDREARGFAKYYREAMAITGAVGLDPEGRKTLTVVRCERKRRKPL